MVHLPVIRILRVRLHYDPMSPHPSPGLGFEPCYPVQVSSSGGDSQTGMAPTPELRKSPIPSRRRRRGRRPELAGEIARIRPIPGPPPHAPPAISSWPGGIMIGAMPLDIRSPGFPPNPDWAGNLKS